MKRLALACVMATAVAASALGAPAATIAAVAAGPAAPIAARSVPVIIIPGTTATELLLDGKVVWPPEQTDASIKDFADLTRRVSLSIDRLRLLFCDARGSSMQPIVPVRMTPRAPPSTGRLGIGDFYAELANALRGAFGASSVYFFGYDWRLDNYRSAADLDAFIRQVQRETGAPRVDIVAHSMGGIVASAYLTRYAERGGVDRVVFLGTPFMGAAQALCVLAGTDVSLFSFMPDQMKALGGKKTTSVHQLMEGVDRTIVECARTYPSVYQLLPERERGQLSRFEGPAARLHASAQARFGAAYAEGTTRRLSQILSRVRVCNIVGAGFPTVGRAVVRGNPDGTGGVDTTMSDGDGIVPLDSALAGGLLASRTIRFPVRHEALVTDQRCIARVITELSRR